MRAKEIELVEFKLDASRPMGIEILMNDNIRFFKGKFCYNTTPYSDATLVDMYNIIVDDKYLEFDYKKRVRTYHSKIDLHSHEMAKTIADFIKKTEAASSYVLDNSNDKIRVQHDESNNSFYLSIQNAEENKWMNIICSKKHGNYFTIVYPQPSKKYTLRECSLEGDIIHLQTEGKNLWDDNDTNISYDWHICLQPDILELFKYLLSTGMQLVGDSCFVNKPHKVLLT